MESPEFVRARKRMLDECIAGRGIDDLPVLRAMAKVPRHLFVEEALWNHAYRDHALPIGGRQTISQPYIVALMTQALELKGTERVLEIGTGSGYQTAILAEIAEHVYSIERISKLARRAREILDRLGYFNINIKVGDGIYGWKDEGPFDAIIVTAATPDVPLTLMEQLMEGGVLVIPVGGETSQELLRVSRVRGGFKKESLGPCRFVTLTSVRSLNQPKRNPFSSSHK